MTEHEDDVDPDEDEHDMHDDTSPVVELPLGDAGDCEDVVKDGEDEATQVVDY